MAKPNNGYGASDHLRGIPHLRAAPVLIRISGPCEHASSEPGPCEHASSGHVDTLPHFLGPVSTYVDTVPARGAGIGLMLGPLAARLKGGSPTVEYLILGVSRGGYERGPLIVLHCPCRNGPPARCVTYFSWGAPAPQTPRPAWIFLGRLRPPQTPRTGKPSFSTFSERGRATLTIALKNCGTKQNMAY